MVERTSKPMEPSEPSSSSQLDNYNIRCLNLRLGSSLQRCDHRGPWSQDETSYHINYLEMLAAFLALQSLTKDLPHCLTVYLYMDNTSAISYLNRRGGTTFPSLSYLAKETWQWCMSWNISLVANHLPGYLNTVADTESRMIRDRWDW